MPKPNHTSPLKAPRKSHDMLIVNDATPPTYDELISSDEFLDELISSVTSELPPSLINNQQQPPLSTFTKNSIERKFSGILGQSFTINPMPTAPMSAPLAQDNHDLTQQAVPAKWELNDFTVLDAFLNANTPDSMSFDDFFNPQGDEALNELSNLAAIREQNIELPSPSSNQQHDSLINNTKSEQQEDSPVNNTRLESQSSRRTANLKAAYKSRTRAKEEFELKKQQCKALYDNCTQQKKLGNLSKVRALPSFTTGDYLPELSSEKSANKHAHGTLDDSSTIKKANALAARNYRRRKAACLNEMDNYITYCTKLLSNIPADKKMLLPKPTTNPEHVGSCSQDFDSLSEHKAPIGFWEKSQVRTKKLSKDLEEDLEYVDNASKRHTVRATYTSKNHRYIP